MQTAPFCSEIRNTYSDFYLTMRAPYPALTNRRHLKAKRGDLNAVKTFLDKNKPLAQLFHHSRTPAQARKGHQKAQKDQHSNGNFAWYAFANRRF